MVCLWRGWALQQRQEVLGVMHLVKHVGNVAALDILKLDVPRLCSKAVENIEKLLVGVGDFLVGQGCG